MKVIVLLLPARLGCDGWLLKDQLPLSERLAAMQVEVVPAE